MKRRAFLGHCAAIGLFSTLPGTVFCADPVPLQSGEESPPQALLIADPHAHPYQFHRTRGYDHSTPTIDIMKHLGMLLSSFSAVGDRVFYRNNSGTPFSDTQNQLEPVKRLAEKGELRLVLNSSDIQSLMASRTVIGGLMAIEGGDALEGKLENLDFFHAYGVRMLTLMHDRDNEIGHNQRSSVDGPLTSFGVSLVEKMNELGMLVDVAHAKSGTLKSITEVCAKPLIDSHTGPFLPGQEGSGSRRLRTWQEMEWVAKTGGVICTWPMAHSGKNAQRTTLKDWAEEIVRMKARLGIEHCGLGTDGGGGLPRMADGWDSIASLPKLISAMRDAGLSESDIAAFVGGNFLRILGKNLS